MRKKKKCLDFFYSLGYDNSNIQNEGAGKKIIFGGKSSEKRKKNKKGKII